MQTVEEFNAATDYRYCYYSKVVRIYDVLQLDELPEELLPSYRIPEHKGKGSPNLNQTRTHYQCGGCQRVLRNDFFPIVPSKVAVNGMFSYCKQCNAKHNRKRYVDHAPVLSNGRLTVWKFIAPCCAACGYNKHPSAMDMHHTHEKEAQVADLVAQFVASPTGYTAQRLARECSKCVPLCSNCHRELHAGVLEVAIEPAIISIKDLLDLLPH
jgi:hypothetical protein